MSHQNNSGSRGRGRSSRPDSNRSRRNSHVGASKPFGNESFGSADGKSQGRGKYSHYDNEAFDSPDGKSQGRGKYSHHMSQGSGSKQFNNKRAPNLVYRPKEPDVISNSVEAEGSHKTQLQSQDVAASDSVYGGDLHSLSANSDSQNIQWGVSGMQIAETPQKEAEGSARKNPDYLCKEETPRRLKVAIEDHTSQEKDSKNLMGIEDSGHSVLDVGCKSYDICPPKTGTPFTLKPSLLAKNRQRRNEVKRAMEGQTRGVLRSGMVLLKNYLSISDQVNIVKKCRDLGLGPGGFYQPGYRDGASLHLKMMCLGKNWDPEKSAYEDIRSMDNAVPPSIPAEFSQLVSKAIQDAHALIERNNEERTAASQLPWMSPDICIVNFYAESGKLGLHQDRDETPESLDKGLPVVSFSIGDTAEFLYGDRRDVDRADKVKLESGDVIIFGGKSRRIFHGVAAIITKTGPEALQEETNIRPGRLNLTFRQY